MRKQVKGCLLFVAGVACSMPLTVSCTVEGDTDDAVPAPDAALPEGGVSSGDDDVSAEDDDVPAGEPDGGSAVVEAGGGDAGGVEAGGGDARVVDARGVDARGVDARGVDARGGDAGGLDVGVGDADVSDAPTADGGGPPSREDVLAAMRKATRFMSEEVAVNGGYVWGVSEDLTERWGELVARPSQIWLQRGTTLVGRVMVDAYEATQDDYYLQVADDVADALISGQHPSGGWHYFIDFDPTGIAEWYETQASRFTVGLEEYRHYYGNATFDDRNTQDAALFFLQIYDLTKNEKYIEPMLKALQFVLDAQYPNGAWPQRYPLPVDSAGDGLPDYPDYYSLNDGVAMSNIELLITAYETLGDARYYDAALLGVDSLIALQGPPAQAAWAEQYGPDLQPIAARTHEPPGYVTRESFYVLHILEQFYYMTGDRRYLAPAPAFFDWLDRINLESVKQNYPLPRYWEPDTNKPVYVVSTDEFTLEGYLIREWTSEPARTLCGELPCQGTGEAPFPTAAFQVQYQSVLEVTSVEERAARYNLPEAFAWLPHSGEEVAEIIAALDERGAWVTDGVKKNDPDVEPQSQRVRGIDTRVYTSRMAELIDSLSED